MAINVVNGDTIRIAFTLENNGIVTTNYYIYFLFDSWDAPTILYPPLRQELTAGEIKTISPILTLENFVSGATYSLTVFVEYPEGNGLDSDYVLDVIYVEGVPQEIFVGAKADSPTLSGNPDTNFGNTGNPSVAFQSQWNLIWDFYMKFAIPDVNITSAFFRLHIHDTYPLTPGRILVTNSRDSTWTEMGITYNNAPRMDFDLNVPINFGSAKGVWIEVDITSLAQNNKGKDITLILTADQDGPWYYLDSRETANPPNLRIIYT